MSLLLQYSMCSNNSLYTQRLHCWNWSPEPEGYSSCTISTKYYRYYQVRNNKVFDSFKRLSFPVILSSFTSYLAVLAAVPIHVIGPGRSICMATNSVREALQKKNHGDSEFGPTPLNPPSPTSDREKKCRDSCVQIQTPPPPPEVGKIQYLV